MPWHVYIIRCKDAVLYTGITLDLQRRMKEHRSGNGCKFTRYRTPVRLVFKEECPDRPQALRREAQIKRLPKKKKLALIKQTCQANKISPRS